MAGLVPAIFVLDPSNLILGIWLIKRQPLRTADVIRRSKPWFHHANA
jgi:hypothetical protein